MITIVLSGLLGLVVQLVIIGLVLPVRVTVLRAVTIDRPAEIIFAWAAGLKSAAMTGQASGPGPK